MELTSPRAPLAFDREQHAYTLHGVRVPSVTGILKAQGLIQLDHIPSFVLERARKRGSDVHALLHYFNEGDLDTGDVDPWDLSRLDPVVLQAMDLGSVDHAYVGYIAGWQHFLRQRNFQILLCEHRIASRRHRVAGTLDCLGILDDEGALIDFKTGDPDDVAADLQTAAYLGISYEWSELDAKLKDILDTLKTIRRYSVRLRRDGKFTVERYDNPRDYTDFCTLTAAYHLAVERGRKVDVDELAA